MDIDARDWHWNVAARAGWPVGVTLLLMVGLLSALLALTLKKTPSSPKPVMRRLLPFLTFMLLALVLTSALIMWKEHYDRVAGRTALISSMLSEIEERPGTAGQRHDHDRPLHHCRFPCEGGAENPKCGPYPNRLPGYVQNAAPEQS